jgi:hypothetical protein
MVITEIVVKEGYIYIYKVLLKFKELHGFSVHLVYAFT